MEREFSTGTSNTRKARPEDGDAIARVRIATWRATYAGIIPETFLAPPFIAQFVERRQWMLKGMEGEEFRFVAENAQEGGIVGYAVGGPALAPLSAYAGELYELYVLPYEQQQGLGHRLLLRTACELAARGYPSMRLSVLAGNWRARRFYERLGGQLIEERSVELAGVTVRDVAYGWRDIQQLPGISCV
jgi:ribosomal protein S18 acetylase RimI-like enzyme